MGNSLGPGALPLVPDHCTQQCGQQCRDRACDADGAPAQQVIVTHSTSYSPPGGSATYKASSNEKLAQWLGTSGDGVEAAFRRVQHQQRLEKGEKDYSIYRTVGAPRHIPPPKKDVSHPAATEEPEDEECSDEDPYDSTGYYNADLEPQNKVYVQFSDNFNGFLPYFLLITEEQGLMFTSLSAAPDFTLDPGLFITVHRVQTSDFANDAFFRAFSRNVMQRKPATAEGAARIQPPYAALVQLEVRRASAKVLVFIAVQTDALADDLVRGCHALKRKRAHDAIQKERVGDGSQGPDTRAGRGGRSGPDSSGQNRGGPPPQGQPQRSRAEPSSDAPKHSEREPTPSERGQA
mmetsp:Transcript_105907/g.242498  ORF Transcript_105907/g.242498 Transcript_105907/m.242498 type:complete len:349 (+) Transcript_105907:10-1056(+)